MDEDLILTTLQQRLNDLIEDYKGISRKLRTESDIPDENRLKRQLEGIEREMQELEGKIRGRQQDLENQAAYHGLEELFELLRQYEGCLDEMRMAYYATTKARSFKRLSMIESMEALKRAMLKIPAGKVPFKVWEEFAARLLLTSENDSLIQQLQQWGESICAENWAMLLGQIEESEQGQEPQTALLIEVSYSDEAATQNQDEAVYRLQVFLIEDVERYRTEKRGYKTLRLDEETSSLGGEDTTYTKEELSEAVWQLLKRTNITSVLSEDSEIHIFLPQVLLNCDVDCWKVFRQVADIPMGHGYSVFVRLHERLGRHYNPRKWKQKWNQKQALHQKNALEVFRGCDDCDLTEEYYELTEEGDAVVGLKLLNPPTIGGNFSIFNLISELGIPLAVWGRNDLVSISNETELDRILGLCCLENLPATVKRERRASRHHPVDRHIGHHLSLLWDDPDLVPPKSA